MITFFREDMQNESYTDSFLSDTHYYDSVKEVYESVLEASKEFDNTGDVNKDLLSNIMRLWNRFAFSKGYKCKPLEDFFKINNEGLKYLFFVENKKYGIPSVGQYNFFDHLYDIQKKTKTLGVIEVDKADLNKTSLTKKLNPYEEEDKRFVVKLTNQGKASRYILVRFKFSVGIFDTIEYKMVAYKNFKTGKVFGGWDNNVEKYATAIYNTAYREMLKRSVLEKAKLEDKPKVGVTSENIKHNRAPVETNVIIKQKVLDLGSKDLLNSRVSILADCHGLDKKDVSNIKKDINELISQHNIELLNMYQESRQLQKFEELARKLYNDAFIRLVNRRIETDTDSEMSDNAANYYKNLTGKTLTRKSIARDREYRAPVTRGILVNSKGECIDGGDNTKNQTQLTISMNDEDFNKLCTMFGILEPNQSDLNGMVEEVLKAKFDSDRQYTLSEKARVAVLYHRDKREQSKVRGFSTCYIPSEYHEYIKRIQKANYGLANYKNSKTFVLSAILHEFIGY